MAEVKESCSGLAGGDCMRSMEKAMEPYIGSAQSPRQRAKETFAIQDSIEFAAPHNRCAANNPLYSGFHTYAPGCGRPMCASTR